MQPKVNCPNCGQEVAYGSQYCAACGTQLTWQSQQQPPPQQPYQQPYQQQYQQGPMQRFPGQYTNRSVSPKSRLAVTLLAFFLGVLGVHNFYLGKILFGVLQLLTAGGFGIWALIDFVMALCGVMKDRDGLPIVNW